MAARVNKSRQQSFFRRNKQWFEFLGTAIVLATFVVNDVLKDKSKSLSEKVEGAQHAFIERSLFERMDETFDRVISEIKRVGKPERHPVNASGKSEEFLFNLDIKRAVGEYPEYNIERARFALILKLFDQLPYDKPLDEMHWTVAKRIELHHNILYHAGDFQYAMDRAEAETAKAAYKRDVEIFNKMFFSSPKHPAPTVNSFGDAVLKHAKDVQEKAENETELWKKLSFALYPLGAIIAFVGKLHGEDATANE